MSEEQKANPIIQGTSVSVQDKAGSENNADSFLSSVESVHEISAQNSDLPNQNSSSAEETGGVQSGTLEALGNDFAEQISKKILVSRLADQTLGMQINFSEKSILLQNASIELCKQKRELNTQLEAVFEKQLLTVTDDSLKQMQDLTEAINALDTPNEMYQNLIDDLKSLEERIVENLCRIQYIESTIPEKAVIENFFAKMPENKSQ